MICLFQKKIAPETMEVVCINCGFAWICKESKSENERNKKINKLINKTELDCEFGYYFLFKPVEQLKKRRF